MAIRSFADLLEMLSLQAVNLSTYATEVGATAGDVTAVQDEFENLDYINQYAATIDADKRTIVAIKQAMYNGDPNEALADFPVMAAGALPNTPGVAGIATRTSERNARFKAAPGYTNEIGVALGIASEKKAAIDLEFFRPIIDLFAAQSGYLFSVVVTNRGESDMWEVMVRPQGSDDWSSLGSATGKSADFTYQPVGDGPSRPALLNIRVQLKKKNENYGQLSDISQATVNP